MFRVLQQGKPGISAFTDAELIQTYSGLTEKMIIWGSDEVLKSYGQFRVASWELSEGEGLPRLLVTLEDLMLAVRTDLGYANAKLERGDVLRLFINDLEKQRSALEAAKRKG